MNHARLGLTLIGLSVLIAAPSCSTDTSGLGQADGGGSGGRSGGGTGGTVGGGGTNGTGGISGTGGAGTGGAGTGGTGTGGGASGGRGGSGGTATGGTASGGRGGSGGVATGGGGGRGGSGGASTGGRGGSGGTASGGRGGSGGVTTGGRGGGTNATGGRGTGGNQTPTPECMTATDCKLYSDCCTCVAQPANATPPAMCQLACIQSRCAQQMLPPDAVDCVAGRCVAGFNCDASRISCDIVTPSCPTGEVPAVNASGSCYAGGCVPASQCKTVTGCGACGGSAPACVTYETQMGNQHHCVTIPTACGDDASCGCLGPTSCVSPYRSCANYSGLRGIICSCPNC